MGKWSAGLSPRQCAVVVAVFWFTSIGALIVLLALRRANRRRKTPSRRRTK
ncbi:hypothetical protein I5E68_09915 [Novosphingobium sp. YJ-S2-02]|uniref:Uncharacterized protein n=1 Tax=Novosphingobium aureum TaxID=2792964 RepID=A0A931MLN6_9SPHN|nr:hypothetical protein [Novosphingobium aureum]MBH0113261.1 hypothetical protein [Novosphingobium aureum]